MIRSVLKKTEKQREIRFLLTTDLFT